MVLLPDCTCGAHRKRVADLEVEVEKQRWVMSNVEGRIAQAEKGHSEWLARGEQAERERDVLKDRVAGVCLSDGLSVQPDKRSLRWDEVITSVGSFAH